MLGGTEKWLEAFEMKTRIRQEVQARPEDSVTYLRSGDQITLSVFVGFLAIAIISSMVWKGWQSGGWVHIDQRPANTYAFLVDVNEADWTELAALPSIGKAMAERIVAHRERAGRFLSLESLLEVEGIGPKTVQKMKPFLGNFDERVQTVTANN